MEEEKLLDSLFSYKAESMWLKGTDILCINKDKTVQVVRGNEIWDKEKKLTDDEFEDIKKVLNQYKNDLINEPENLDDGEYVIMDGSSYEIYAYGRKFITDLAAINSEEDDNEIVIDEDIEISQKRKSQKILNNMMTEIEHIVGFKWADEDNIDDIEG